MMGTSRARKRQVCGERRNQQEQGQVQEKLRGTGVDGPTFRSEGWPSPKRTCSERGKQTKHGAVWHVTLAYEIRFVRSPACISRRCGRRKC